MDDEADIIIQKEASEKQNRIAELEEQRQQELQSRKWMSSCPERKHSYVQYPIFDKSKFLDILYCVYAHKSLIYLNVLSLSIYCNLQHRG